MTFIDSDKSLISRIKTYRYQLILLGIIVLFLLFYFSRINRDYIESWGDNYSYELFAETVFSSHPFKVNFKIDFFDEQAIFQHQYYVPPLYPIFLAIMHHVFGEGMLVNFFATSVIGVLCALPVFKIGKLLWSERVGVLAAAVVLISPTLRDTSVMGMSEPLMSFINLWGIYYFLRFTTKGGRKEIVLCAIFTSLTYLTRYNGLSLIAAGLILFLFWQDYEFGKPSFKQRLKNAMLFMGVVLIVISPWLMRNYLIFGDPLYNAGRFYVGINPGTTISRVEIATLGSYLNETPWPEIFQRYGKMLLIRFKSIYTETGVLSLLVIFGVFAGYYRLRTYLIFWLFLFFTLGLVTLVPGPEIRYVICLFPLTVVLGIISMANFYQNCSYKTIDDFMGDNLFRQAFFLVSFVGIIFLGFRSYNHYQPISRYSEAYPLVGQWFIENTAPDTVIMADPVPSVYYYARRPLVMFPRGVASEVLSGIMNKYNVKYLVVFHPEQLESMPEKGFSMVKKIPFEFEGKKRPIFIFKYNRLGSLTHS